MKPTIPTTPSRLSEELEGLLYFAKRNALSVEEIIRILGGRGLPLVICILCVPFLFPVAIPGLSIPFGIAMAVCGFRIALGKGAWLPKFLLRRKISYHALEKMVHTGSEMVHNLPKTVHTGSEMVHNPPKMVHTGSEMVHNLPKTVHTGSETVLTLPKIGS